MPWVESVSPSFRARHDQTDADEAHRVLYSLERTRPRVQVPGSREMLELTAAALYARGVVTKSSRALPRRLGPGRIRAELRWAWLLEGAARWFSGQTDHARPAISRRLREGPEPPFPPGVRDAALLGGTVVDLLVREQGEQAAADLACTLHPHGPRAALTEAFGGRPLRRTEDAWRSHLARINGSARTRATLRSGRS